MLSRIPAGVTSLDGKISWLCYQTWFDQFFADHDLFFVRLRKKPNYFHEGDLLKLFSPCEFLPLSLLQHLSKVAPHCELRGAELGDGAYLVIGLGGSKDPNIKLHDWL